MNRNLLGSLVLTSLLTFLVIFYNKQDQVEYTIPLVMVWTFVAMYFCPCLSTSANTRPDWYEDLAVTNNDPTNQKFQQHFLLLITVLLTIASGVITDYCYYLWRRDDTHPGTIPEVLAFFGGILSLFNTAHAKLGDLLIAVLLKHKRRLSTEV